MKGISGCLLKAGSRGTCCGQRGKRGAGHGLGGCLPDSAATTGAEFTGHLQGRPRVLSRLTGPNQDFTRVDPTTLSARGDPGHVTGVEQVP